MTFRQHLALLVRHSGVKKTDLLQCLVGIAVALWWFAGDDASTECRIWTVWMTLQIFAFYVMIRATLFCLPRRRRLNAEMEMLEEAVERGYVHAAKHHRAEVDRLMAEIWGERQ